MSFEKFKNYIKTIEFILTLYLNRMISTKLRDLVSSYVLPRAKLWLNGWTSSFRIIQGYRGDNAEVPLLLNLCRMS